MSKLKREKEGESSPIQKDMECILSSLANEDALRIFQEAKEGITSSTETIKKLRLTQKRYYARLKPLIEAGLIDKTESGYKLTFLGKIIYEILYRKLKKTLENRDRIALIDKLNKAESLSMEEKEQIKSAISTKDRILGYSGRTSGIKPVEIVRSFKDLVKLIADLVENAKKEILLASRYTTSDTSFVEPFLRAFKRGVKIAVLDGDKSNFSRKLSILRILFSDPRMIVSIQELFGSPNMKMRYVHLPYSFAVIDGEYVIFEVTNMVDDSFLCGFLFDNEEVSANFAQIFNELYKKGGKDPFAEFIAKFKK